MSSQAFASPGHCSKSRWKEAYFIPAGSRWPGNPGRINSFLKLGPILSLWWKVISLPVASICESFSSSSVRAADGVDPQIMQERELPGEFNFESVRHFYQRAFIQRGREGH